MAFFCLPIIFGFSQRLKQTDGQISRLCPRCNNAAVVSARKRTYFELFCVPIFPINSKQVWVCGICQWIVPLQQGWEPALPGQWQQGPPPGQWQQGPPFSPPPQSPAPTQFSNGYNPSYPPPIPPGRPPNKS